MADQPVEELIKRMKFEKRLSRNILDLFRSFTSQFIRNYTKNTVVSANIIKDDLYNILVAHYSSIISGFQFNVSKDLREELAFSQHDLDVYTTSIENYMTEHSIVQTDFIIDTTDDNVSESIIGSREFSVDEETGKQISQAEIAIIAGAILRRKLFSRVNTIATTETTGPIESIKAAEVEALLGRNPTALLRNTVPLTGFPGPTKEWITAGDERVRPAHLAADGQKVSANESFEVGGQYLNYPGDTSLGATIGNVAGCRCLTRYNEEEIIVEREKRLNITAEVIGPLSEQQRSLL